MEEEIERLESVIKQLEEKIRDMELDHKNELTEYKDRIEDLELHVLRIENNTSNFLDELDEKSHTINNLGDECDYLNSELDRLKETLEEYKNGFFISKFNIDL